MPRTGGNADKDALPGGEVIRQTVETTERIAASAVGGVKHPEKPAFNASEFFHAMSAEERDRLYTFYLYHHDDRIHIVEPRQGRFPGGTYLLHLELEDLKEFEGEPFDDGMRGWVLRKFGGSGKGTYEFKTVIKKTGVFLCSPQFFTLPGERILSAREAWKPADGSGQAPSPSAGTNTDQYGFVQVVTKLLDGLKENRIDPATALTQAMEQVSRIQSETLKNVAESAPKDDPLKFLTAIKTAIDLMGIRPAEAAPARDAGKDLRETISLLKDLNVIPSAARPEEITKDMLVEAVKTAVSGVVRGNSRGSTDWTPVLVPAIEKGFTLLGGLVQLGVSYFQARSGQPPQQRPRGATVIGQRPPAPQPNPSGLPPAAFMPAGAGPTSAPIDPNTGPGVPDAQGVPAVPTGPGNASPGGVQPADHPPAQAEVTPELYGGIVFHNFRVRLMDWITHEEWNGEDAAATLKMMDPQQAMMIGSLSPELIMSQFIERDDMLNQIAKHPRLAGFLREFHEYFNPTEEGDEGEGKAAA
jgi:hypothetical protein